MQTARTAQGLATRRKAPTRCACSADVFGYAAVGDGCCVVLTHMITAVQLVQDAASPVYAITCLYLSTYTTRHITPRTRTTPAFLTHPCCCRGTASASPTAVSRRLLCNAKRDEPLRAVPSLPHHRLCPWRWLKAGLSTALQSCAWLRSRHRQCVKHCRAATCC
jgi:hypothetical protein